MTEQKYNGWVNYQTWLCKLWMDNDQGTHELQDEYAWEALVNNDCDKDAARSDLAERLESFWDEIHESENLPNAGFFADLINHGLGMVDWHEIAENILSDIDVYSAGWNMPGYMPDNEPARFLEEDDAKSYIKEEIERYSEELGRPEDDEGTKDALAAIDNGENAYLENFVFWVTKL